MFETPEGPRLVRAGVTVLALGGASWPRLGSDAAWVPWLRAAGVAVAPFRPANMGFHVDWSPAMAPLQGAAVKGTRLSAGALESRGEWVLTGTGIEGGAVYEISAALRDGARIFTHTRVEGLVEDGGTVRGVLLWNVWDSVDKARELIAETAKVPVEDVDSLRGRIPFE